MQRRVVVTGIGVVSALGNSLDELASALQEGRHGIRQVPEWGRLHGVQTGLGGVVEHFDLDFCSRKQLRASGKVAKMAIAATHQALLSAGLPQAVVKGDRTVLIYGSTDGSCGAQEDYDRKLYTTDSFEGLLASSYLKFMSHTCAANLAQVFGIVGRVVPICSACTSASQSIGEGFVSIATGREDVAICGGAEEAHATVAGVFDLLMAATRRYNDQPDLSPRPFDAQRDGLVIAEGAGTLILESWEHAQSRGAPALAEVVGFGSSCDGAHLTTPSPDGMAEAMRRALASASLGPGDIDYINAHATGTAIGDVAESLATHRVMGEAIPISSTKGHTGHTLGACGAIEAGFALASLRDGFVPPTRNLERVDEACASLDYVRGQGRDLALRRVMSNNFAFGGINTSLVFARV